MNTLKEEMFTIQGRFESSELSARQFCMEVGISEAKFWYWRKKWRASESNSSGDFVPILVDNSIFESPSLEVVFPNGVCVRMSRFDASIFQQIVRCDV